MYGVTRDFWYPWRCRDKDVKSFTHFLDCRRNGQKSRKCYYCCHAFFFYFFLPKICEITINLYERPTCFANEVLCSSVNACVLMTSYNALKSCDTNSERKVSGVLLYKAVITFNRKRNSWKMYWRVDEKKTSLLPSISWWRRPPCQLTGFLSICQGDSPITFFCPSPLSWYSHTSHCSTVCTLLSATFLRACTLERLFVAHNPNERRPKLPRPTWCGAQQSAGRCDIDPSQHSPSERIPIAHVLISLALAPNDAQPKSPPPNVAPSQKRTVQYSLDPVKRHPLWHGHNQPALLQWQKLRTVAV